MPAAALAIEEIVSAEVLALALALLSALVLGSLELVLPLLALILSLLLLKLIDPILEFGCVVVAVRSTATVEPSVLGGGRHLLSGGRLSLLVVVILL